MREAFLLDPHLVFLNHGSYGACPRAVFAEYQRWQRELERNPVEFLGRRSADALAHARSQLAAYLGADAGDLAMVTNATTAVGIVARSLALEPGDEVLATDHEYGACDTAWQRACAARGASYRRVPAPWREDGPGWAQALLDQATPRTRLVFASHVASPTGSVFAAAALCRAARERGILTLIDGAHAPGQVGLDLAATGADFYAGNCHKWLCAPKGAGFLHARPEQHARLEAPVVSWGYRSAADGDDEAALAAQSAYTGSTAPERRLQWQGTRDIAAMLSVPAAIDFQRDHDWPARRAACRALACDARRRVQARNGLAPPTDDAAQLQMVPIAVDTADPAALQRWLFTRHRIEVPVYRLGAQAVVRVSVQAYNTPADLDALVDALAEAGV